MNIEEKLDLLGEMTMERDLMEIRKKELLEQLLSPEIKKAMEEIEEEFKQKSEAVDSNIKKLTEEIKPEIVERGSSLKGRYLHAVYSKGRVTYDSKALESLEKVFPLIKDTKKVGEPSVSIKAVSQ